MHRLRQLAAILAGVLLCHGAHAAGPLDGRGQVEAHDAASGVVYIAGRTYQVVPRTRLRWDSGEDFTLESLILPSSPDEGGLWPLLIGQYDAVEEPSGLVLNELILLRDAE